MKTFGYNLCVLRSHMSLVGANNICWRHYLRPELVIGDMITGGGGGGGSSMACAVC